MNDDSMTLKAHIDGVDHTARRMEDKWGVGLLPLLVDAETRAKFYRQGQRLRDAKKEEEADLTLHDIRACRILLKTPAFMRNMLEIAH